MESPNPQTALGSARERFALGLPERARELTAAAAELAGAPEDESLHENMRRRLHALYATAQVFQAEALSSAVQTVIGHFDAAHVTPELREGAERALAQLAERMTAYVGPDGASEPQPDPAPPMAAGARGRRITRPPAAPPVEQAATSVGADASSALDTPASDADREARDELDDDTARDAQDAERDAARDDDQDDGYADEGPHARELEQTVAGFLPSPATTAVLVVDAPAVQARMRELLPRDQFDVFGTNDPDDAIRMLHAEAPDVALVSGELASLAEIDLVHRLQTDPLSNLRTVYVLLPPESSYDDEFLRQTGADGVIVEPIDAESIATLIQARSRSPQRAWSALAALSQQGTVDDIAASVAEEIRRGIAESLQAGRNETIDVADKAELMAAAWSAIGRVRSHLAEQSRGRVQFRNEAPHIEPTFVALGDRSSTEPDAPEESEAQLSAALAGRRILLADDDPAVLWFFSGLAREAGATVLEAQNGRQALELARRKRPQVVVSDILMPKIDGFALCREIKRDALLSHVPVILLSWKDDFLQRMRELDAGANGYLRKEAGARQILSALNEVLRPRLRLEAQLQEAAEARGRIEGLGIFPLIETVCLLRPDARLNVRDAWNLFELDIRNGEDFVVTRTAADGSFARGDKALLQLVGVTTGRFSVSVTESPLRSAYAEPLDRALLTAGKRLGALLDAVSDTRLLHVGRIEFDEEVVGSLLSSTPTPLAGVVQRFRDGAANANEMLLDGSFTPGDLEEHLRELARRGAIVRVWSTSGDDLVSQAAREREERPGSLLHASQPPQQTDSMRARAQPSAAAELDDDQDDVDPADVVRVNSSNPPKRGLSSTLAWEDAETTPFTPPDEPISAELLGAKDAASDAAAAQQAEPATQAVAAPARNSEPPYASELPTVRPRPPLLSEAAKLTITLGVLFVLGFFGFRSLAKVGPMQTPKPVPAAHAPTPPKVSPPPTAASAPVVPPPSAAVAPPVPPPPPPSAAPTPELAPAAPQELGATNAAPDPATTEEPAPSEPIAAPTAGPSFGQELGFVDRARGVEVKPDQGLLVVEQMGTSDVPQLRVDARDLGKPPIAVALAPGRHELALRRGGEISFRYVIIHAGTTRVVTLTARTP